MDRRRALLAGGKKTLYIYQPGFTAFQNATYNEVSVPSMDFGSDSFTAGGKGGITTKVALYVDFTGYKKLVFDAYISGSANSNNKIGWKNTGSEVITNGVNGYQITATRTKRELDISSAEGQKIISMEIRGSSTLYLYDMHLE